MITVQLKIELLKLYDKEKKIGWDDPLSHEDVQRWVEPLQLMKKAELFYNIPRCIKPNFPVGNPDLVLFNDGSAEAMC